MHNLSQAELSKKEEALLKGGETKFCACVCTYRYAGEKYNEYDDCYGESSTMANDDANTQNAFDGNL